MRQITDITRRSEPCPRYEKISYVSGNWGRTDEESAIHDIKYNKEQYYVRVGNSNVNVIIASFMGRRYLRTEADSNTVDILLDLPEY